MTKAKYDKYFVYKALPSASHPEKGFPWIHLMRIDDRFMKGAFYFECVWFTGPIPESEAFKPHSHDADEYIGFFGSNIEDPTNLNAEIQFWMDDEKHIITKNCIVFVPAGVWHTPIIIDKIERPIFGLSTSPVTKYTQNVNRDPKWAHLKEPPESTR